MHKQSHPISLTSNTRAVSLVLPNSNRNHAKEMKSKVTKDFRFEGPISVSAVAKKADQLFPCWKHPECSSCYKDDNVDTEEPAFLQTKILSGLLFAVIVLFIWTHSHSQRRTTTESTCSVDMNSFSSQRMLLKEESYEHGPIANNDTKTKFYVLLFPN